MNPLESYPGVRKALYLIQFIVAGVVLLFGVAFTAAGSDFPKWYTVGSAVASALWSYLGLQAAANTPSSRRPERGSAALTLSLISLAVLLVLLVLVPVPR